MLRFELKRAFNTIGFKIALLIGIVIAFAQAIVHTMPAYADPLRGFMGAHTNTYPVHLFVCWMGAYPVTFYSTFVRILPILATMAYGISFATDYNSGYIKNIVVCKKREEYLRAKYISVFVAGGLVAVIPLVVNLLFTACLVPTMKPFLGHGGIRSGLYYTHPFIYLFLNLLCTFLYAGAFSTISLAGAFLIKNRFLLSIFPFALWYILGIMSRYTRDIPFVGEIAPSGIISFNHPAAKAFAWIEWLLIAVITYAIFIRKGRKLDVI